MNQRAQTYLIQYQPYEHRNECCAIGLFSVLPSREFVLHLGSKLKKVKAIDPACDLSQLREGLGLAAAELSRKPELLSFYQKGINSIRVAPAPGYITYDSAEQYKKAIDWALATSVEPRKTQKEKERLPNSKLFLDIKNTFSALGWLAGMGQGINDHLIVPRYPIAPEEGLNLDFALKNGALHCLQTADLRPSSNSTHRKHEAQSKMLALGLAPQLTQEKPQRYTIFAGGTDKESQHALKLAERVSDEVYMFESQQDMTELMGILAEAMGKPVLPELTTH